MFKKKESTPITKVDIVREVQPDPALIEDVKPPTREERIEEIGAAYAKCDENLREFTRQLVDRKNDLLAADRIQRAELNRVREKFADMSAKGILDQVYKLANEDRKQLLGNISKLDLLILNERERKQELGKEKKALEDAIEQDALDAETREICEKVMAWIKKFNSLEVEYESFYQLAAAVRERDRHYFNRVQRLGYPESFLVILDSYLRPDYLATQSMTDFIEKVAGLRGHGPQLIGKKLSRQPDVDPTRDTHLTPALDASPKEPEVHWADRPLPPVLNFR
jgi:hypothetical protein